ncbi:CIR protein, partial [Plasmodium chabaudi adami]
MATEKMCKLFLEGDGYFNGKDVDMQKINNDLIIKSYCSNGDCKTNGDGINALTLYIFMEFKRSIEANEYNDYDEYLLMWLSDKLFKMHLERKGKKDTPGYMDGTTLNQAYDTYLKNHKVGLDYWALFDIIKGLKEANLKYMSEFYKLLNHICKIITDYNDNGAKSKNLSRYSASCSFQYKTLYMNVSECKSYLDLLNKLKGIYDDFRNSAIKETSSNNNLATKLQKLVPKDGEEMDAVRSFISYKFNKKICNSLHKKTTTSNKAGPPGLSHSSQEVPLPQPLKQLNDSQDKTPAEEPGTSSGEKCSQVSKGDGVNGESVDTNIKKGCSEGGSEDSNDGTEDTNGGQDDKGGSDSEHGGSDSVSLEKETQSTLGDPFNTGSFILSVSFQGMEKLNDAITSFGTIKKRITECTDTIKNLYSTSLTNLENTYDKYSSVLKEIINSISTDSNEVDPPGGSGDSQSGSGGDKDNPPSLQKDSHQKSSDTPQLSQDSPEKGSSGQTDQGGSENPVDGSVIISENPGSDTKGNGTIGIGDIYIFKEFKKIGIPIII